MPPNPKSIPNHVTRTYHVTCFSLQPPAARNEHCFPEALPQSHKGTSHDFLLEPAQRVVGMSWHCASLSSLLRISALPLRGNEAKISFCWGPNWHLQTGGRDRNLRIQSSSKTRHIWNQAFLENGHHIDLATLTNCLPLLKIISAAVLGHEIAPKSTK